MGELIDLQMSPLGLVAMDALAPARGQTVVDVGCGTGQTLLQLSERVGEEGQVIGVDVAPRVLAVARSRTTHLPQVTLLQEDAANLALPTGSVDAIYSRFGVMFFCQPNKAFANMHRMLRRGGRIGFVCWRSIQENELDALPVRAAHLPVSIDMAPFSFERAEVIESTLRSSGFSHISIEPHDALVSSGDSCAMLQVVTGVGALGKILREDPQLLPKVERQVRAALAALERDGEVRLASATWIVVATAA